MCGPSSHSQLERAQCCILPPPFLSCREQPQGTGTTDGRRKTTTPSFSREEGVNLGPFFWSSSSFASSSLPLSLSRVALNKQSAACARSRARVHMRLRACARARVCVCAVRPLLVFSPSMTLSRQLLSPSFSLPPSFPPFFFFFLLCGQIRSLLPHPSLPLCLPAPDPLAPINALHLTQRQNPPPTTIWGAWQRQQQQHTTVKQRAGDDIFFSTSTCSTWEGMCWGGWWEGW